MEKKYDVVQELKKGNVVQIMPRGYSMYPLFVPGRDWAILAPPADPARLKVGDVAVFRRDTGLLVIHRICRVRRRGGEVRYHFIGDNQTEIERGIRPDQIIGVLVGFERKGRKHSTSFVPYRLVTILAIGLVPVRPILYKCYGLLKRKNTVLHGTHRGGAADPDEGGNSLDL